MSTTTGVYNEVIQSSIEALQGNILTILSANSALKICTDANLDLTNAWLNFDSNKSSDAYLAWCLQNNETVGYLPLIGSPVQYKTVPTSDVIAGAIYYAFQNGNASGAINTYFVQGSHSYLNALSSQMITALMGFVANIKSSQEQQTDMGILNSQSSVVNSQAETQEKPTHNMAELINSLVENNSSTQQTWADIGNAANTVLSSIVGLLQQLY